MISATHIKKPLGKQMYYFAKANAAHGRKTNQVSNEIQRPLQLKTAPSLHYLSW
jgi:hypothetical protein